MNRILNINLGGYALTIDDDAHQYLEAYLDSIRRRFKESEGRDEIVGDIEARLGELIAQSMGTRTIVMLPDVEAAVNIMGKPEDFGGEEPTTTSTSTGTGKSSSRTNAGRASNIKTGKRLFRDEEDSVVSGVCSGLSAYFGIADPVWIRLIFVLLAFGSFGFWIPGYFLLWVLVPAARTTADRLAMRGEPATMENIAREIEDSFEKIGNKVNEFGATDGTTKAATNGQKALNTGVSAIGQMFGMMVRFIGKFAWLIALFIGLCLLISIGTAWIAGIWGLVVAAPFIDYFSPFSSTTTWLGVFNGFFLFGIPIVGLCLMAARVMFRVRTPDWLSRGMGLFWVLNLVSIIILTAFASKNYRQGATSSKVIDLSSVRADTLRVEAANFWENDSDFNDWGDMEGLRIGDNQLDIKGLVEIRIKPSSNGTFRCTQVTRSRGESSTRALENAEMINFPIAAEGNVLRVPVSYGLEKGTKWRVQRIRLNIEVPVGKSIVFDDKIYRCAAADMNDYTDDTDGNYISRSPNKVFRMTSLGLECSDCPKFGDDDYNGHRRYDEFIIEGDIKVDILEGNDFKVRMEGPLSEQNKIERIQTGDKLTFTTKGQKLNGTVRIIVETPVFTSLYANDTDEISIRGFNEGQASISAKGRSLINAYFDCNNLNLVLSGAAKINLTGKGDDLDLSLSDDSSLDATGWRANQADVSASGNARAQLNVKDNATVISQGNSQVRVDGGASVRNTRD